MSTHIDSLNSWPEAVSDDAELKTLSDELSHEFAVERALLPSGVSEQVRLSLPRPATPLVRCARMLAGAVLLAGIGCVGMALVLVAYAGGESPLLALRLVSGLSAVTVGVLLNFAAPRLVMIDARIVERLTGRLARPGAGDLVLVRAGALLIMAAGALVLLP